MSNKIVPGVYRAVIDEVISAIRPAFDEFDIAPDVLQELQHKWETKILASRVADFGSAHSTTPSPTPLRVARAPVLRAPLYPALALPGPSLPPLPGPSLPLLPRPQYSHTQPPFNPDAHAGYALPTSYPFGGNGLQQQQQQNQQNQQNPSRPQYDDSAIFDPFSTAPLQQVYRLPQTDGPSGSESLYSSYSDDEEGDELEGGEQAAAAPRAAHPSVARPPAPTPTTSTAPTDEITSQQQGQNRPQYDNMFDAFSVPLQQMYRVPQTDGPSGSLYSNGEEDDEDEDEDELEGEVEEFEAKAKVVPPRTAHPSVARPQAAASSSAPTLTTTAPADDNEITSDLDDSDSSSLSGSDAEGGGGDLGVEGDILFCTYEKVTRTKNKWKCVLKDGVVHAGGRDWLFGRCTGEFEW